MGLALLFALAVWARPAFSQEPPSWGLLSKQACAAYQEGRYSDAARLYDLLVKAGLEGAAVHYDLGNCHLREGDLGHAILEYRRALKYDPGFEPAQKNLEVARHLLKARVTPWQPSPWETFVQALPDGWLGWAVLLLSLLGNVALGTAFFLGPGSLRRACVGIMVGAFVSAGMAGALMAYARTVVAAHVPAVIIESAPVYSGPEVKETSVALLPPGSEVIRLAQAGDWSLVLWGEGRGWALSRDVESP